MADAEYDPVAERASFAQSFRGTTNLEQRRRFAQDITRARAEEEERRAQAFEAAQQKDPSLMQAVTARRRENRQLQEGFERGDLARQRMEFDIGKEDRANALARKKFQLDLDREDRFLRKEEAEINRVTRQEEDELGFDEDEQKLREQVTPGSTAYQRGIFDILMKRKHLDRDFRNNVLKAAGVIDPEEAWKQAADAVDAGASRVTARTPAGVTATFTNEKVDLNTAQKRLDGARKMWAEAKKDGEPSNVDYAEARVRQLEQQVQGLGGVIGTQPSQPQVASQPQDFTSPEDFTKAFQAASPGTVLMYKGKPWKKP